MLLLTISSHIQSTGSKIFRPAGIRTRVTSVCVANVLRIIRRWLRYLQYYIGWRKKIRQSIQTTLGSFNLVVGDGSKCNNCPKLFQSLAIWALHVVSNTFFSLLNLYNIINRPYLNSNCYVNVSDKPVWRFSSWNCWISLF